MPQDDPYKYFRIEAAELTERLSQGALDIDKGAAVAGGVAALLRHAHTLKGAARVVRQVAIADHAHTIEDLLAPHRSLDGVIPRECGSRVLAELDAIGSLLAGLAPAPRGAAPVAGDADRVVRDEGGAATLRAEVADVNEVIEGLGEARVEVESLHDSLAVLEQTRRLSELLGRQLAALRRADPQKVVAAVERAQRVTEDVETGLQQVDRGLRQSLTRLGSELGQTHAAAERLRLLSASSMFTSLERAAHDAAEELGQRVRFVASGGDVKLDGHMLGLVQSALLHVVRNAVVHGAERASDRQHAGKAAEKLVHLAVSRRGRDVVFSCQDDGAGLDVAGLRRALSRNGDATAGMSDDQLLERLLRGGVSTSRSVTRLAGRGVGLDVVREAADRLGGSVHLATRTGQGFSVELCLPMSVAAVLAVVVECNGRNVALPLDAVVKSVRFSPAEITHAANAESVCHQGRVIPFAPLARALGMAENVHSSAWSALIVRGVDGQVAVGVDRLLGARSIVLRPLPEAARAAAVVAGASLDALGNPELVLDADGLVSAVQRVSGNQREVGAAAAPILVIDDSLTTRMLEQSILESAGYAVELATSGEEGLAKARAKRYALFLVDVEMPGIDGFTFVDRARSDPALSAIPAVLVSSRSAPEDLARGKSAGARGYIVKDRFDQRELLGLIQELVSA